MTFGANMTGAGEVEVEEVCPTTGRLRPSEKKNLLVELADDSRDFGAWDSTWAPSAFMQASLQ